MSTPPVPPPPPTKFYCSWVPGRTTKKAFEMHHNLGHAKNALRAQSREHSNYRECHQNPGVEYRRWTQWADGAIWEWDGTQWVLLFHTVEGQSQDPW